MAHRHVPYQVPDRPSTAAPSTCRLSPSDSNSAHSSSNSTQPTPADPVFLQRPTKVQQTTDKSCVVCRERRVRCSREWPRCTRCVKRREECVYGEGITVETKDVAVVDPRVKQLEAKLATLESQIASSRSSPPLNLPLLSNAATTSPALSQSIQSAFPPLSDLESATLLHYLVGQSIGQQRLGERESLDWRLARPRMGELLTLHLLDAAQQACCARLPSLKPLMSRIPYLQSSLPTLSPTNQAAVALLSALGARSSSHSAVLGLAIPGLADGTADPKVYLTVGARREKACRALYERAAEVCWLGGVLAEPSREGLETLVGLAQVMIFEEIRPRKSRFYLRNAVGMYSDMQADPLLSQEDKVGLRRMVGNALYLDDAIHSAQLSKHPLIPTEELPTYFASTGLSVPDFNHKHLHELLEETLMPPGGGGAGGESPVTMQQLEKALDVTGVWVCYLQRSFASLTTARRPSAPSILTSLQTLWTQIDVVHSSVQRLQNYFVNLQHSNAPPPAHHTSSTPTPNFGIGTGKSDTPDTPSNLPRRGGGQEEILGLRIILYSLPSGLIRDCFYSRLYLSSMDKHVVHHLTMQLELLPSWTTLAVQTVGQPGGPSSPEFEVSNEELDWLLSALRLALFYTPRAAVRLNEVTVGKAKRSNSSSGTPSLSHSRVASPPSPEFPPSNALPGASSSFPVLGAPISLAPESTSQNGGSTPSGLTRSAEEYYNPQEQNPSARAPLGLLGLDGSQQQYHLPPSQQQQYKQQYSSNDYPAYPSSALQQRQYSLPPPTLSLPSYLPSNPTPPSSSIPGVSAHLHLPTNSPSHHSTPYSPYRPSSSSLPSNSYPSQWAFNAFGFPSISPQFEKNDPFALGEGEMESWMSGAGWGDGGGGGGATAMATGAEGAAWEEQAQKFEAGQQQQHWNQHQQQQGGNEWSQQQQQTEGTPGVEGLWGGGAGAL
ncbi:hypothetical protein BCR35DRAFT_315598 [Leucosporidium creatinivorum]|uniref:Zn(2)-C6 fungal-type domain-containing protein n=1 Tax=Leucosporidium creatinivorum TaxID=106004 RepID=A0A1Y2DTY3_9BASI|nr:hypothetical protein BCR35DRAFT_315598 [Leucosporidium creatinivorum]